MCVTMVIICSKTLEKEAAVSDVTPRESDLELQKPQTMNKGTTLFSCGSVEASRWRDLGRSCGAQWDVLAEACQGGGVWGREVGGASSITSLIRDLSLTDSNASPAPSLSAAPPSKRQCRSFSDEFGCGRSTWRPAGSRVWVPVEKRRCHSGGSVQRVVAVGGAMQRSFSFSLPTRSNAPPVPLELPCPSFTGVLPAPGDPPKPPRALSLSHERISLPALPQAPPPGPSAASSPESTPELGRRAGPGGLARSRSQPCVLNEKKAGVKRRRPEDRLEPRPSLDLAKMTQKLRNFQSLSCPGITGSGCCQSSYSPPSYRTISQCETDYRSPCVLGAGPQLRTRNGGDSREQLPYEELDTEGFEAGTANGEEGEAPWEGSNGTEKDAFQLGGELDIEQIERN
ncbi:protein FAM53B-like [Anguilla rostrata]|uniref:protein FAM53B-like n=1 Tax=Anguilla rostrata TaxID=7938 RepID=UPI0030D45CF6